jgi:hypothetical protein
VIALTSGERAVLQDIVLICAVLTGVWKIGPPLLSRSLIPPIEATVRKIVTELVTAMLVPIHDALTRFRDDLVRHEQTQLRLAERLAASEATVSQLQVTVAGLERTLVKIGERLDSHMLTATQQHAELTAQIAGRRTNDPKESP